MSRVHRGESLVGEASIEGPALSESVSTGRDSTGGFVVAAAEAEAEAEAEAVTVAVPLQLLLLLLFS